MNVCDTMEGHRGMPGEWSSVHKEWEQGTENTALVMAPLFIPSKTVQQLLVVPLDVTPLWTTVGLE